MANHIKGMIILDNHESIDEIFVGESSFYFNVIKSLVADLEVLFVCFVALRPKSTAMVIAGRSVHLTTLFPGQA